MDEQPTFTDPWWDLRRDDPAERQQRQTLHAELLIEVAPGHPLHGQPTRIVARSEASDDILVQLPGRWALIHLTWKGVPETPPWPKTKFYDTIHNLVQDLHEAD
ncbi:hypothetical protein [Micromonospora sp. KC723]|uniref:hypothetical protein n=1 Tax=Micromonospora sp. KC723 TaxID=2530381 RepID=UPI0014046D81|nr:hypothetical protein [Micromonospora sp. KC723]